MNTSTTHQGLLGDTVARDYSRKLKAFNAFARNELRRAIASLGLRQGMCVLDVGCGTGEALQWLADEIGPEGTVIGMDLAMAHVAQARALAAGRALVIQADLQAPPLPPSSVDLVWAVNTFNHLQDPVMGLKAIIPLLRPGGRIALGQSSLLPDAYSDGLEHRVW